MRLFIAIPLPPDLTRALAAARVALEAHGATVTHDRDRVELQARLDLPQPRRCYLCFRWHDSKSK